MSAGAERDPQLARHFDYVDRDGNGRIDREEFADLLRRLGAQRGAEVMDAAFRAIDRDHSGHIDYQEFSRWWNQGIEDESETARTDSRSSAPGE